MKIINKAVQSDRISQHTREKAVHAELAQERNAMTCVVNFLVNFAAYCARVAGPLLWLSTNQKDCVPNTHV